jgi:hypothetical protein
MNVRAGLKAGEAFEAATRHATAGKKIMLSPFTNIGLASLKTL